METLLKVRAALSRANIANALMVCFILGTTTGAAMLFPPAGFIVFGVTSGIFGYLLGSE
jgi:hypothetical protein